MSHHLDAGLQPRNGVTLQVLIVCRISGPNQDIKSLGDQEAKAREVATGLYDGPIDFKVVASRGSGEYLDRRELQEIEELLESRRFDVLITEDLGRIARRIRAYDLCELADDCKTRVLALNDAVDTGREGWQMNAFFSVVRHEMYNRDTAARIRRSLRNRFTQGGVIQFVPYGIVKPSGAENDSDLVKDPAAAPIYDRWFTMLEEGAGYSEIADWLNQQGIPTGPCARSDRWTCRLVRYTTFNPILKGVRVRNEKMSKRINKTGRRRSVNAPPGERLERTVPHLAFIEPARYDRVIALLRQRNAIYRRRGADGRDGRKDVPRKRTLWPGQHLTCGVCGRIYYYGGHGRKEYLMCSGCRDYVCWNAVAISGPMAADRISAAVRERIEALPDFNPTFAEQLRAQAEAIRTSSVDRLEDVDRRLRKNRSAIDNIMATLAQAGPLPSLIAELTKLEADRDRLQLERQNLERLPCRDIELPSREQILEVAKEAFADLAHQSPEFGRLMRRLIPRLEVRPYRLIDGGQIVPKVHLTLDLAPLIPEARALEGLCELLRLDLVVDVFDPPQRAEFREQVVAMRAAGRREKEIAETLGLTIAATQRAAALDRMMRSHGLTDPYVEVVEPPDDGRFRRHNHQRYRFQPGPETDGPTDPGNQAPSDS